MISSPILKILLVILVVGFVALAFAAAHLSGRARDRFQEDTDDPPRYDAARQAPAAPEETVQAGVPGEIVAAIAAAVACLDPGAVVTSVRRAPQGGVSAWKLAGLLENTRPF